LALQSFGLSRRSDVWSHEEKSFGYRLPLQVKEIALINFWCEKAIGLSPGKSLPFWIPMTNAKRRSQKQKNK
jgi:hypothetical protein